MVKRVLSSIIGLIIFVPLVVLGGIWLKVGLAAIAIVGMMEFYRAFGPIKFAHFVAFGAAIVHIFLAGIGFYGPNMPIILLLVVLAIMLNSFIILRKMKSDKPSSWMVAIDGFFYIAVTLSAILLTRENFGLAYVWLIFISAWGCDTGAYFAGKSFGRHKLAPRLSPNKTVEGSIGGTVAATFLGGLYGLALYMLGLHGLGGALLFTLCAFVCSIAGQVGDLAASSIKRHTKIKDFGNILPGHGGVLDRFDSIIFTAPLAYILLNFLGGQ